MTDTINTRELIMNILLEMDREKTPCHLAVKDALDKYQFLPRQDRAFIKRVCEGTVEYGIQVNGKIRARVELPADMDRTHQEKPSPSGGTELYPGQDHPQGDRGKEHREHRGG